MPSHKTKINIVPSSGQLRVTVHPRPNWLVLVTEVAIILMSAVLAYTSWTKTSLLIHLIVITAFLGSASGLIFQLFGTEIIEFDQRRLTLCKEIHGWERTSEYRVEDCRELEWTVGAEDQPSGLKCTVGWKTVWVSKHLSELEANEILVALQQNLPDVAQKMGAFPESKAHFLTLGLRSKK